MSSRKGRRSNAWTKGNGDGDAMVLKQRPNAVNPVGLKDIMADILAGAMVHPVMIVNVGSILQSTAEGRSGG